MKPLIIIIGNHRFEANLCHHHVLTFIDWFNVGAAQLAHAPGICLNTFSIEYGRLKASLAVNDEHKAQLGTSLALLVFAIANMELASYFKHSLIDPDHFGE